jgi:23S rRNA pseudouridine1911/1915/1917 synthase
MRFTWPKLLVFFCAEFTLELQVPILYQDDHLIAVSKPSGLFTQAARGVPSLQEYLIETLSIGENASKPTMVGIIHRLDRQTSGIILFGKSKSAVAQMNDQFRQRVVRKSYLAIVQGTPAESGTAIDWMRKIPEVAQAEICDPSDEDAKEAILHWRLLASDGVRSLVEVDLETGRMHQIRMQFSSRGYPIVGDVLYGAESSPIFGLHAAKLSFRHPKTAKSIDLNDPAPAAWQSEHDELISGYLKTL